MQPILKYPGAKWRLSNLIIDNMPTHRVYLEPFFGSGAVLFNKVPSGIETVNDLDGNVVNLFRMIRERPRELADLVRFTPWARDEYYDSYSKTGDELEDARRFLVRCWQAFATRTGYRSGWRHSAQGQCPNMPEQWAKVPSRISEVADRLKHVQIENVDAIKLIEKHNNENVFIYADPPYMPDTRGNGIYACEMTEEQHNQLISVLVNHKGSVIISGYDNALYNNRLCGWRKIYKNTSAERGRTKQEVLWLKC